MTCGIYCITNTVTGDRYVGASVNIETRLKGHRSLLMRTIAANSIQRWESNKRIQQLALDHGIDAFCFGILESCEFEQLADRESFWIDKLSPSINTIRAPYSFKACEGSRERSERKKLAKALKSN